MIRSRTTLRSILAASVACLLVWGTPAAADEAPAPAGPDPRVRVIAYNPQEVVKLYAVPGATLTIQLAPGEIVAGLPVSDQSLLDDPEPAGPLAMAADQAPLSGWARDAVRRPTATFSQLSVGIS